MTPAGSWNEFARIADPLVAFGILFSGVGLLAARNRMAALQQARVASGELSAEQAAKNAKVVRVCAYGLVACGVVLVITWLCRR